MKRTSCMIKRGDGTRHVAGYLCGATGLAVYREGSCWYATHLKSGLSATPRKLILKTRAEAMRFVDCLTEKLDFSVEEPDFGFIDDIEPVLERFLRGYNPNA